MDREALIRRVMGDVGLTREEAQGAFASIIDAITEALIAGVNVRIARFGQFEAAHWPGRATLDLKTKEPRWIEPRRTPRFKPSAELRARVREATRQ